jgi:D-alanyl-D-alanine carboxypeptidase/D-alanyl-D-alanine endopeptidase (penicillin-binding protein 7)
MLRACVIAACLLLAPLARADVALGSAHAIVVDDDTGEVLLQKNVDTAAPIASLTKLMTAMVVLDAQQDPNETIQIVAADLDRLKRSRGGVRVGAVVPRGTLLELALVASDNHAAAAIARSYPGGRTAFDAAVQQKIDSLGLTQTVIEEPTGLSPHNRSSAQDMAKVLRAAAAYPTIAEVTSKRTHAVLVNGRLQSVRNTNGLVGAPGWNILLSKTGYTNEAGRCVSMRLQAAGRTVSVVLLGALGSPQRALDALNIRRWLAGEMPLEALPASHSTARAAGPRKRAAVVPKTRRAVQRFVAPDFAPLVEPAPLPAADPPQIDATT